MHDKSIEQTNFHLPSLCPLLVCLFGVSSGNALICDGISRYKAPRRLIFFFYIVNLNIVLMYIY